MDRLIIYPAAIPLETDLLNTNRNMMEGLGRLAMDLLGTTTLVSGLACAQTTVPSMSVAIGAGAIYSMQPIDSSAYSSLPANTTDTILKQGILRASANKTITLTAPGTPGTSIIYLIEAAFSEIDSAPVTLPYYNASNPSVAYSGPGGSGAAQNTVRAGTVSIQAKAGTPASVPTAPPVDAGYVPLYYVTIAYGATSIVNANIAVATGAPFIPASLSGLAALSQFGNSLANPGYQKLPGGLIVQWGSGTHSGGSGSQAVTFPQAFPNACLISYATNAASGPPSAFHGTGNETRTGLTIYSATASGVAAAAGTSFKWLAIGY